MTNPTTKKECPICGNEFSHKFNKGCSSKCSNEIIYRDRQAKQAERNAVPMEDELERAATKLAEAANLINTWKRANRTQYGKTNDLDKVTQKIGDIAATVRRASVKNG